MSLVNWLCISWLKSDAFVRKLVTVSASTYNWADGQHRYDIVVIGGGIVGTATARELAIRSDTDSILLLVSLRFTQRQTSKPQVCDHRKGE